MIELTDIHAKLVIMAEALIEVRGELDVAVKTDTAFALGEALGVIMKAKALVGRDIDEKGRKA